MQRELQPLYCKSLIPKLKAVVNEIAHLPVRDVSKSRMMCTALVEAEFVSLINARKMDRMLGHTPEQPVCNANTLQRTLEKLTEMSF